MANFAMNMDDVLDSKPDTGISSQKYNRPTKLSSPSSPTQYVPSSDEFQFMTSEIDSPSGINRVTVK